MLFMVALAVLRAARGDGVQPRLWYAALQLAARVSHAPNSTAQRSGVIFVNDN
jgi:hypothetical protein